MIKNNINTSDKEIYTNESKIYNYKRIDIKNN